MASVLVVTARRVSSGHARQVGGGALLALACLVGGLLAPSAQAACSAPAPSGSGLLVTCPPVGAEQSFVVPAGVSRVHVSAVGASGVGQFPGRGALASGDVAVTPGHTLYVLVGGDGRNSLGGFNGGADPGSTGYAGGGGGGASDVRTCAVSDVSCDTLASRLIVAAGGGGGGGEPFFTFGGSGGMAGTDANGGDGSSAEGGGGGGGGGATRSSGGSAGSAGAGTGALGVGGRGGTAPTTGISGGGGGGGGGGLFGGGGGGGGGASGSFPLAGGGGGGGSSFGPAGTMFSVARRATYEPIPSVVTLQYVPPPPFVVVRSPRDHRVLSRFVGRGQARKRRLLVISGSARDPSGLRRIALTVERLPRKGTTTCRWLNATAGVQRRACDKPAWLIAKLAADGSWTYRVSRRIKLAAGRYRVSAYGQDNTLLVGNSAPAHRGVITFRLT